MAAPEIEARIERFRQMAQADPENELGHFSLGRAYIEAGRHQEAIASLQRALQINANRGPVYHLLAQAQLGAGRKDDAVRTLAQGVKVAAARGELLARDEMILLLQEQGAPIPQEAAVQRPQAVGEGQVLCSHCGQAGPKLPRPPFRNAQGQLIYEKICANCWREWIAMGTKVINELRLPMNEPEAQKVYDKHMYEFLNLPTK